MFRIAPITLNTPRPFWLYFWMHFAMSPAPFCRPMPLTLLAQRLTSRLPFVRRPAFWVGMWLVYALLMLAYLGNQRAWLGICIAPP